jgi:hypothetical protein
VGRWQVLAGYREFRAALDQAGIPYTHHEDGGGHFIRHDRMIEDIDGIINHLRG